MCLIALIGFALPRFALFLMWLFTDRLSIAFDSFILGFLGFILLPYTTLFYALAYNPLDGVTGFGWFVVGFGFIVDISAHASGGRAAQERRRVGV
jgi:hypothetical protein